mgnify:CR=1 FL=1
MNTNHSLSQIALGGLDSSHSTALSSATALPGFCHDSSCHGAPADAAAALRTAESDPVAVFIVLYVLKYYMYIIMYYNVLYIYIPYEYIPYLRVLRNIRNYRYSRVRYIRVRYN